MRYVVVSDVTPSRCTVLSVHDTSEAAVDAAEQADTGINGMPAEVMQCESDDIEPGERARHECGYCYPA